MTSPLSGPAFIAQMPPSPETSRRWWTMYCRECGIEEMMSATPDEPRLIERRDAHNRDVHGPSPLPTDEDAREVLAAIAKRCMHESFAATEGISARALRLADAILAAGFRRSVVSTSSEDARVWVCARCGYAPAAHAIEGHPAFRCVYEPHLADPAVSAPPTITDEALLEAYRVANERAMHEVKVRDGFASNMSRESILAGLRAVATLNPKGDS